MESLLAVSLLTSGVSCLERSGQGESTALVECCDEGRRELFRGCRRHKEVL